MNLRSGDDAASGASLSVTCSAPTPAAAPSFDAIVDVNYAGTEGARVNGAKTFTKIESALNDAPANATRPYVIQINNGRYYEKLIIGKAFITLIGESRDQTILTFDSAADTRKPDGTTWGTTGSATITVRAPCFRAEDLTIENGFDYLANSSKSASDPTRFANAQAVALKTERGSDRAVFKNVRFVGYQDTLYADASTHYFSQCSISGNVDFIFGAGQAVFHDCDVISRERASAASNGCITAASTSAQDTFGFLFLHCCLKKENPAMADNSVALGRPWHPTRNLPDGSRAADPNAVASVAFVNCWMDSHITARGWESMTGRDKDGNVITFCPSTARFAEFASTGPGALANDGRPVLTAQEAETFSIKNVLAGWDPS